MKPLDYYEGREQTYLKHFVFERYLEIVAIKIGMKYGEFVLVDGFSGPWRSSGGSFDDTSFMIAIEQLRRAQNVVRQRSHPNFAVKCLFIEKDEAAYQDLRNAINNQNHILAQTVNGEFEDHINTIKRFAGNSFIFLFVDPTGWQGFGLEKMLPLMQLRGEVLINFMYDHINRFIEHADSGISDQMNNLMGGTDWRKEFEARLRNGLSREDAILETYKHRLKLLGGYKYVSSIRVMKPMHERSYFHLIYGTQALPGIQAFSQVEKKVAEEQRLVRARVKDREDVKKSNQIPMFGSDLLPMRQEWFEVEKQSALHRAKHMFLRIMARERRVLYDDILGPVIEIPLVWESDLKTLIASLEKNGDLSIEDKKPRQRVATVGNFLLWHR